ncbi:MAG: DNA mismatch repair protein MutS2 [Chloroflexi bacterium]|jgi:DNA mismatch repair protein MutS2|nr:MAG: DNA mismatch repair protein MutS2 [Chloroflexota bacterium]
MRQKSLAIKLSTEPDQSYRKKQVLSRSLDLVDYDFIKQKLGDFCTFSGSRKIANKMFPSYFQPTVSQLQIETEEGIRLISNTGSFSLRGIKDHGDSIKIADLGGALTGQELLIIANTIEALSNARSTLMEYPEELPVLLELAKEIPDLSYLAYSITSKIAGNGLVLDNATPNLGNIRRQVRESYSRVTGALESIISESEMLGTIQDDVISTRGDRLVVQVKSNMRSRVPGIVHDASNTGMTLFIEPFKTVSLCNSWREFTLEEEREVQKVLQDLSSQVGSLSNEIDSAITSAANLDFVIAKSKYSISLNRLEPDGEINGHSGKKDAINLIDARHPMLGEDGVPLSLQMGPNWTVLVITGPNTGGKTVAIKTVGLLAAMNQSGIQIPAAAGSELPIFDGIYADIGDQQSITNSVSTFSSHITNLNDILDNCSSQSLLLLDEVGSSTDPEEGSAIAKAVLEYLAENKIQTLITTHHNTVTLMAESDDRMRNASFQLDPKDLKPTYKMVLGLPGQSYAMAVATRLGLKDEIVKKADKYLSAEFKEISDWITRVTDEKNRISETMGEIESQYKEVESIRSELNEQIDYLIQNRQTILDSIHHTAEEKYKDIETLLKKAQMAYSWVKHTNESPDSIEQDIDETAKELKSLEIEKSDSTIQKPNNEEFQAGDTVTVRGLNLTGVITKYNQLTQITELKIGNLRMDVDISRLSKDTSEDKTSSSTEPTRLGHNTSLIENISFSNKIDIRGMRAEPSLQVMETFLDESLKNGLSKVFIVHGKGTGALRKAIRESLEGHPLVNSFGSEPDALGEDGATYVVLN